jgi:MoxR-like ATPase
VIDARQTAEAVLYEIRRVIVGQDAMLERVLVALLAGGHLLLEGVPGLAKTLTIKTLADVLHASFRRIQFTPDLVGDLSARSARTAAPSTPSSARCSPASCSPTDQPAAKVRARSSGHADDESDRAGPARSAPVPRDGDPIQVEGTYPLPEAGSTGSW